MPSIQQISQQQMQQPTAAPKFSNSSKYLKIIAAILLTLVGFLYYTSPKIITIPDNAIATINQSQFKELFGTPYKKVIWFGPDCPMGQQKKRIMETLLKGTKLDKFYIHRPFLQGTLIVRPGDELGLLLMKHCFDNVCIIDPSSHKIVQTTEKNMLTDLIKFTDEKNWQKKNLFEF